MTMTTELAIAEVERVLARLRVEATPFATTDANGNPAQVAAGELIESAWGNAVADRVVKVYPTVSALAAASAPAGQLAVANDTHIAYVSVGGGWMPLSPQRGEIVGPPGNYPAGTAFITATIPDLQSWRVLSFTYNGLVTAGTGVTTDIAAKLDGSTVVQYRLRIGEQQQVSFGRTGLPISPGPHTLTLTNNGNTIGLVNDATFNQFAWMASPSL